MSDTKSKRKACNGQCPGTRGGVIVDASYWHHVDDVRAQNPVNPPDNAVPIPAQDGCYRTPRAYVED